jgi:hypothetical protein
MLNENITQKNFNRNQPLNLIYYEPSNCVLFTNRESVYELSYHIDIFNKTVKFVLLNKTLKKTFYSEKLESNYFSEEAKSFERFNFYFVNVFSKNKGFYLEIFDEETIKIKVHEYDSFQIPTKSYYIVLLTESKELDKDKEDKDDHDSVIEAEIVQMANELEVIKEKSIKDEIIKKKEAEIIELQQKINLMEIEIKNQVQNQVFNTKYAHLPGIIKYCKGLNHGCTYKNPIWGSNPYTLDTTDGIYCQAARHSGVIDSEGGFYLVKHVGMINSFIGKISNNITSGNFGSYNGVSIHMLDKDLFNKRFQICGNINL